MLVVARVWAAVLLFLIMYCRYHKSMDVTVRLWHRLSGAATLGFTSSDGELEGAAAAAAADSPKRVCLGQVDVPLSKLFDGRRATTVDQWCVRARCRVRCLSRDAG